jgi:transmembrane sensor
MSHEPDRTVLDDLIIRVLSRQATPEEAKRLDTWRIESPDNARYFASVAALWSLVAIAAPARPTTTLPPIEDIIAEAEEADADGEPWPGSPRRAAGISATNRVLGGSARRDRTRFGSKTLLAATVAVIAFGVGLLADGFGRSAPAMVISAIVTGADEMVTVSLDDGTSIRVGPRSTLRITAEGNDRVAWLEGRAFFGVNPNPSRTFTVRTPHGEAVVLGTRFEVRSDDSDFRVLVVEGSVRVSAAGTSLELGEGVLAASRSGGHPEASLVEDVEPYLAWMGRTLLFQSTPLRRAIADLERLYGVDVQLADSTLSELDVTASFTDRPIDEVVLVLCAAIGAECSVADNEVWIGTSVLTTTPVETAP